MNCIEFEQIIAQSIDEGLVQEHLRSCSACAKFADQIESDRRLLQSIPPETADVDFAAMRRQIRSAIVEKRRRNRIVPVLLLAASILIAVAVTSIRQATHVTPPVISKQATPPAPPPLVLKPLQAKITRDVKVQKAGPAVSPAIRRVSPPQPDPALEAALQEFLFKQTSPPPAPSNEIRIATNDPNVILILIPETNGVSNE